MTQSAVSRQSTSLEEFAGLTLLRRTCHGVALTEQGADYALTVAHRLQGLEQVTLDLISTSGCASTIHLVAVPSPICASRSSHSGGPHAGDMCGGCESALMCSSICRIPVLYVMNAISRICSPHIGHSRANTSKMRAIYTAYI